MSSLIRSWTEGNRQPACPVIVVLLCDLLLCLLTPLFLITTVMIVLTSKDPADVFGGDNNHSSGYTGTREPAQCARVSVIMMGNFVAMEGCILMVSQTLGVRATNSPAEETIDDATLALLISHSCCLICAPVPLLSSFISRNPLCARSSARWSSVCGPASHSANFSPTVARPCVSPRCLPRFGC